MVELTGQRPDDPQSRTPGPEETKRRIRLSDRLIRGLGKHGIQVPSVPLLFSDRHDTVFAIQTPGKDAIRIWQKLTQIREDTGCVPVIIGADRDTALLLRNSLKLKTDSSPQQIIEAARKCDPLQIITGLLQRGEFSAERIWQAMETGDWDEDAAKHSLNMTQGLEFVRNRQGQRGFLCPTAHEMVTIGLIPTTNSLQAPAFLKFGSFNNCPHPKEHIALLEHFDKKYKIEVIGLTSDSLAVVVTNPPDTREEALKLAKVLFGYSHGDGVQSDTQLGFSSTILNGKIWSLWWG